MAFLTPDRIRNEFGLIINEKILKSSQKPNRLLSKGTGKVEWITIHNTEDINEAAGTNDAEQYARATFNGNMGGVTVHYYIDESGCWQLLNENEVGYHAADGYNGQGNTTSLAIEIIMDGSGSKSDREAEDRGALLAAILLYKHGLSINRLTNHYGWYPKKYCPQYILPHWNAFKKTVEAYLENIKNGKEEPTEAKEQPAENEAKSTVKYYVQIGAFKKAENATAYAELAHKAGFDTYIVNENGMQKVQIGAFSIRKNADDYVQLAKSKGLDAFIIEGKKASKPQPIKGDVDGDGKLTSADARLILRGSVGLEDIDESVADMNGDGKVTAEDSREALRKSVGLD